MIYRFGISTPKDTYESGKQKTPLLLARGVIHQIDIVFPPGPIGLLHVQINRGLYQVWPSNSDEDFACDNNMLTFKEHYELIEEPLQLECYTWNTDDTYAHNVIIRIGILPRKFILRRLF